jgi:hypothetical protein
MIFVQRGCVHARAIGNEAGVWIRLFPEVTEGTLLEVVDESIVGACRDTPQQ